VGDRYFPSTTKSTCIPERFQHFRPTDCMKVRRGLISDGERAPETGLVLERCRHNPFYPSSCVWAEAVAKRRYNDSVRSGKQEVF
jgi:hypothetical protein